MEKAEGSNQIVPPRAEASLRYAACAFRVLPPCALISMVDPNSPRAQFTKCAQAQIHLTGINALFILR